MKRFLPFAILFMIGIQVGARPPADRAGKARPQAALTIDNTTYVDANTILMFVTNHGNFGRDLAGVFGYDAGTFFPYTTVDDIESGLRDDDL